MTLRILVALCCLTSTAWAQNRQLEWPAGVDLSSADKRDILALAKRMGIDEPVKVAFGRALILGDPYVTVESRVIESGRERQWSVAFMFRDNWRGRDDAPPPSLRKIRVGRWIAIGETDRVATTRIQDGDWFVDLRLGAGVPYEDAQLIVVAVRRQMLVNRLQAPLPALDPARLTSIAKAGSSGREYSVNQTDADFSGYDLQVRIVGEQVEVYGASIFVVECVNAFGDAWA